jgi:hypothetical protein
MHHLPKIDKSTNRQIDKSTNCKNVKSKKRKSFTLVEVVFTISIIGVLLAILMPAMSAIKLSAQKIQDVSHLKKIAEAWRECVINRGWTINGKDGSGTYFATAFAEQLAGFGKTSVSDMVLNDANVYISPGDRHASKLGQESLCKIQGNTINWTGAFSNTSNFMNSSSQDAQRISYCVIANLPATVPLNATPLGFTRGLREDGKWDEKAGLYGSKGGYVVYCDGHTTWFDGSRPAKFLHWNGQQYTSNIRETVPNSTLIACGNRGTKTDYRSDGSLVILYHAGLGGN